MLTAQVILWSLAGYALIGTLFAVWFVFRGVSTLDPGAKDSPLLFRVLIFPGVVAFWPLLARRCRDAAAAGSEHQA